MKKTIALALALALTSGVAVAQSVGNGNPGRANTKDPNSSPKVGSQGTRPATGVYAAGRANTSDPGSAMSGGTDGSGRPANPAADPRKR